MFLREVVTGQKSGNPVRYAQIVESYRNEQGKSRHRVLMSLGRVDSIDKERVEKLIRVLSRFLERGEIPQGGRVGETRDFGVAFLAQQLWEKLKFPQFFSKLLRSRKFEIAIERAIFAMVAHRLCDPASKRACAEWLELDVWIPTAKGITSQHLYRAMDFLDEHREELEEALCRHRSVHLDPTTIVYFDTTSTYFECDETGVDEESYGIRQRGYSRDLRPDRRQIVIGLATDQHGCPLLSEVFSGETTDALTVVPLLHRLKKLNLSKVVWVTDRGMASDLNLSAVKQAGLQYIIGARLRADEDLRAAIHADRQSFEKANHGVLVKEVNCAGRRLVVCFSPASAERDHKLRNAAIERLKPVLDKVNMGADDSLITGNGWYKRLTSKNKDGSHSLDKNKLEREAQCYGTYVLEVSDAAISAKEAANAYKGLLRVEQAFRVLKHGLDIRPVYHRLEQRIRAHVTLCVLGYLLESLIERETHQSFEEVRRHFHRIRAIELQFDEQNVWETSVPSPEARKILNVLRFDAPPRVLTNSP